MLESVKTRLRATNQLTAEIERRIVEFERRCLAEIRSEELRRATIDYLESAAPLEFFTAPASSTGQTHPAWQSLPGGILLNTVECCIGADRKIRMYPELTDDAAGPNAEAHDVVYIATILSDTFKPEDYGRPWTEYVHHTRAAEQWRKTAEQHGIERQLTDKIASAILWHLGRFTPDWPAGKNPRDLSLLEFIVHELDMDFSNKRLAEVFDRRLGSIKEPASTTFLDTQFESASSYFQHVEGKLTNLLVFFATLLVAVVSGAYYIGSSEMFRVLTFCRTPRAFLIGLLLLVFGLISLVFIGVYVELRVRKIRMLEQMAAIREFGIHSAQQQGEEIRRVITMVSSIPACPPYLRRPSEDWYTLLLIALSSSSAIAVATTFWTFWLINVGRTEWALVHPMKWLLEGSLVFILVSYTEFAWFTTFCFREDLQREKQFSSTKYVFFAKHGSSFPWPLQLLDKIASDIEKRHRQSAAAGKDEG